MNTPVLTMPPAPKSVSRRRPRHVLPGFGLTLGYTLFYLTAIVLIPFTALIGKSATIGFHRFWTIATDPAAIASYQLSYGASLAAALCSTVIGFLMAWVLTRYEFPGRRVLDALVDLPFALPTAVAGIALTALYSPREWIGGLLFRHFNLRVAFTPLGIVIALIFVSLPFVVRTLQPVIADLKAEVEEAAACLGASRWQTFRRVIFPTVLPALLTGATQAFGRAVGEYGSVVFISGNIAYKTQITPFLITSKLDQFDYAGGAVLGVVMLGASLIILASTQLLQRWAARRMGQVTFA